MILTRRHPELNEALFQKFIQQHEACYSHGNEINSREHQGVSECQIDGIAYIIKRYSSRSPLSALRLLTRSSRADRSFHFAHVLTENGIATPKQLLVIKHLSLCKNTTYLIMEKSKGIEFFHYLQPEKSAQATQTALQNIGRLVRKLNSLGIKHGDLHTRNILINNDQTVEIIDLDGATLSKKGTQKDHDRLKNALEKAPHYWAAISTAIKS